MSGNVSSPADMSGYYQRDGETVEKPVEKKPARKPRAKKISEEDLTGMLKNSKDLRKSIETANKVKARKEYYDALTSLDEVVRSLKSIKK